MRPLILIFVLMSSQLTMHATNDSTATHHRDLQDLEVVGVKQMPTAELAATTKITGLMARRYDINNLKDVSEIAPNFYIPEYGSRMTSSIYVRGLGARMDQPIVGLSVDNVPVMNKDSYDFDVADIESIEVLRGAQSLLNGRNTMGGQINIRTLSPWTFEGVRASVGYGRYNDLRVSAGIYKLFKHDIGSSLTATYARHDGIYINEYNGSRVGGEKNGSIRWKLGWRPRSWLSMSNVAAVSIGRQNGYPYESLTTGKVAYNDTCFYRRTNFSDGFTVVWAGKRVVVTSVTTSQYIDDNMTLDQDFLPEDYFTLTQKRKEWAFTQDLFTKGNRGNYGWLGGVFAFTKSSRMDAPVTFYETGISQLIETHRNEINPGYPIRWDDRQFTLGSDFRQYSRGVAIYHESTYKFGRWEFQAGLRWDCEWVGLTHHSQCDTGYETFKRNENGTLEPFRHTMLNINDRGRMNHNYMELLPKISVSYSAGDQWFYATVTKAYKAGGYNTQMFSDVLQQRIMQYMGLSMTYDLDEIVSYKPEKSWNYEFGIKTQWLNGRLTADAAVFFIDCSDQQLTMFPPGMTTGRIMTNAGRTYSKGFELSSMYQPHDAVTLRASYGYTHATFRKFSDAKGDYKGKRLPYAPAHTLFAGADWKLPVSLFGMIPSFGLDVRGVGDIYWNEANTERQNLYALLGASFAIEDDQWGVRLRGENLTATNYNTFYFVSIGNAFVQKGRPWQISVTLNIKI